MTIWTKAFWKGTADRAIKTFIQTATAYIIASVGAESVGVDAGILDVSWLATINVAALATFLSVAMAVGNADSTAKDAATIGRRAAE